MAYTLRGRTVSGDNISVGSASGQENFQIAVAPPAEKVGGKDNIQIGVTFPTANIADNQQLAVATMLKERVGLP